MNRKLLFFVNVDWFFLSHRIPIAIEALKNGYDVYLFTKTTGKENIIKCDSFVVDFVHMVLIQM